MTSQVVVHGDAYRDLGKYIDEHTVIVSDPPFNMRYHYRTYKDSLKDSDYWDGLTKVFSQAPSCVIMYPESLYVLASHLEQIPGFIMPILLVSTEMRLTLASSQTLGSIVSPIRT